MAPAGSASESAGFGPRNIAKTKAATSASTNETPKVTAGLPAWSCASLRPVSRCQAFPKRAGEYHAPPITNARTAATSTAP